MLLIWLSSLMMLLRPTLISSSIATQSGVVAVWLGMVAMVALGVKHHEMGGAEVLRKIVHIGTGNVILLAWWLRVPAWMGLVTSFLFSVMTLLSYWLPILPMLNSVGRKSLGTFFYAVSIGLLIAVFWPAGWPQYAVIGVLVMTWGDGLAALIGQTWGRHTFVVWGSTKSWEGCMTMAIASFWVTSLVLWGCQGPIGATWMVASVVAIVATALELFSKLGIDNLTVPLASGAIAFMLNHHCLGL